MGICPQFVHCGEVLDVYGKAVFLDKLVAQKIIEIALLPNGHDKVVRDINPRAASNYAS
jgi:hypothetical protein